MQDFITDITCNKTQFDSWNRSQSENSYFMSLSTSSRR